MTVYQGTPFQALSWRDFYSSVKLLIVSLNSEHIRHIPLLLMIFSSSDRTLIRFFYCFAGSIVYVFLPSSLHFVQFHQY